MHLNQHTIETIIVYVLFDVIILRLIFATFLKRQMEKGKGRRYGLGVSLIFLGVILTSFGMYLATPYREWKINEEMIAGVAPFLVIGVPSLVLGIFLVNNP